MKQYIKKIFAVIISLAVILSITGCDSKTVESAKYDANSKVKAFESGEVCENDNYIMSWDGEVNCVVLTSKATGEAWSSIPYEYYSQGDFKGKSGVAMQSPIEISYYKKGVNQIKSLSGYMGAVRKGRVASEKTDNGLKVTYYFDEVEIAVPVYYVLNSDSVSVYVIPSEIEEHDNKICEVALSPYFCSVSNSSDNYLFVPSGSGALMYTDIRGADSRKYEEEVYGADLSMQQYEKFENRETVRMSVFGAAGNENGIMGIITDGAEAATVVAESGNESVGYSNAYVKFLLRSYNISQVEYSGNEKVKNFWSFAESVSPADKYSVTYYPLTKDSANYNGMAEVYRDYLAKSFGMTNSSEDALLNLEIIGGALVKKFFMGIPYYSVEAATTIDSAKNIINELQQSTDSVKVRLYGFGQSGILSGKVAGGYKLSGEVGSKSDFNSLNDFCIEKGIDLFVDYNVIFFNKSGSGFKIGSDAIRTVNGYKANQNIFSIALRDVDETKPQYFVLNRKGVDKAVEKLAKKSLGENISLSNFGSVVYSDFSNEKYYNSNGIIDSVVNNAKRLKESGKKVSFNAANDYAAAVADAITNAPTVSSRDNALDIEIPFYQMIFKGNVSVSNTAINSATDKQKEFLKSVESGMGITYAITSNYNTSLMETQLSIFVNSLYSDNKEDIIENIENYSELFSKIASAKISEHTVISDNARKTVFDNGITVLVNYGETDLIYEGTTVPALNFSYIEG